MTGIRLPVANLAYRGQTIAKQVVFKIRRGDKNLASTATSTEASQLFRMNILPESPR